MSPANERVRPTRRRGDARVQALLLALVVGLFFVATRAVPEVNGGVGAIAAVGFLLLAGTLASELVEPLGLPHISGYIAAGVVAGPYVLKLLDHGVVEHLSPVNTLALSLIALAGGAELKLDLVRRGLRSLVWSTCMQTGCGVAVHGRRLHGASRVIPFAHDLRLGAALRRRAPVGDARGGPQPRGGARHPGGASTARAAH